MDVDDLAAAPLTTRAAELKASALDLAVPRAIAAGGGGVIGEVDREDPQVAAQWAASIGDEELRIDTLESVARSWMRSNANRSAATKPVLSHFSIVCARPTAACSVATSGLLSALVASSSLPSATMRLPSK